MPKPTSVKFELFAHQEGLMKDSLVDCFFSICFFVQLSRDSKAVSSHNSAGHSYFTC